MPTAAAEQRIYEIRSLEVGVALPHYHDWLMEAFRPHLRGRVIEVGAGIGTIAQRYVDSVESALLVEPAMNLHAVLHQDLGSKPNVRTHCGLLDEAVKSLSLADGSFDVAIMVNVLEHIEDDVGVLRTLGRLLGPRAALLLFVPATPFLYGRIDEKVGHVRRYTRTTLRRVVNDSGFEVGELRYFDLLGMLPWFVTGRLLGRSDVNPKGARVYDDYVVPVCRAVDRLTRPRVGKNLICIATKSG